MSAPLDRWPDALIQLGNIETKLLTFDIEDIEIKEPLFITGLARGGTTILLEFFNSLPQDFSAHHYGDFPFLHANYFWNRLRFFMPPPSQKAERAHKDGIMVNSESPEALEEILWTAFFEHLHKSGPADILDETTDNPAFEAFYRAHIQKLILLRGGRRYLAKNNYNVTRIPYLKKLFPDARFIIPVRDPVAHIYSLLKQHKLITTAQNADPRAARYMRRHGHFEFGEDFRPIYSGSDKNTTTIKKLWAKGEYLRAYSLYWRDLHDFIQTRIVDNPALKPSCRLVDYEQLCARPYDTLQSLTRFCHIEDNEEALQSWSAKIKKPDYYKIDLSAAEQNVIREITGETYKKLCGSISI